MASLYCRTERCAYLSSAGLNVRGSTLAGARTGSAVPMSCYPLWQHGIDVALSALVA